jgi:hypothetical protein
MASLMRQIDRQIRCSWAANWASPSSTMDCAVISPPRSMPRAGTGDLDGPAAT